MYTLITPGALRGLAAAYLLIILAFGGIWLALHNASSVQQKTQQLAVANHMQLLETKKALGRAQRALRYECSTNRVLDGLVVAGAAQIEQSFANGTYQHLLERGIISEANVQAARDTLAQYKASHKKLTDRSACNDISR